jgi:DNA-binding PadR family transcriptional regulator
LSATSRVKGDPLSKSILQELDLVKPVPIKAVKLREKLTTQLEVSHQTFYLTLTELVKNELIRRKKQGKDYSLAITEKGEEELRKISLNQVRLADKTKDSQGAQAIREIELYGLLQDGIRTKLKEIEQGIDSLVKTGVFLTKTRVGVWNTLGDLYDRADRELLIMGKGADVKCPEVSQQISFLTTSSKKFVDSQKSYRRIQPIDTWITWLEFLYDLKYDETNGQDRENVKIYFTDERPEFIPQINIKDDDELVLVPLEDHSDRAHCFHIFDRKIIQNYRSVFLKREETFSEYAATSNILKLFIENARKMREMQARLLVVIEFDKQRKFWTGSNPSLPTMSYEEAQLYFSMDWTTWDKVFTKFISDMDLLADFCSSSQRKDLWQTYTSIFKDVSEEKGRLGMTGIPTFVKDSLGIDIIESYLKQDRIREAAKDLIRYLSETALTNILTSLIKELG